MEPNKRNFDQTSYYSQIVAVFESLPDDATRRSYVAAVSACFDLRSGNPDSPSEIAQNHGFKKGKLHEYKFVLAKNHAQEFFIEDARIPGVSVRDIRAISGADYRQRFEREPFTRGRSSYWFSVAEWILLLELPGWLPLPSRLQEFAAKNNL